MQRPSPLLSDLTNDGISDLAVAAVQADAVDVLITTCFP
jgi:hypothetical protein